MRLDASTPTGWALRELTWRVRVMTTEQLGRLLVARCAANVSTRSLTQRLGARGYMEVERAAAAFHEVHDPLVYRLPNGPAPDFAALARKLATRWQNVNTRRVTLCWATPAAARLLGGLAAFAARSSQLEHDLGTASILVRLHETRPQLADCWIGEDILRRDFAVGSPLLSQIPDAALICEERIVRVVEFGGQYSARRLRRFDTHFFQVHRIPYEIW